MKAMSALSLMGNPSQRGYRPQNPRIRRLENVPAPVQAGSTTTIHDVSYLGFPDYNLARDYNLSLENNYARAIDAKRLGHAAVWATLRGVLEDPPPPYTKHAEIERDVDARRVREGWERGMDHRRKILDQVCVSASSSISLDCPAHVSGSPHCSPPVMFRCWHSCPASCSTTCKRQMFLLDPRLRLRIPQNKITSPFRGIPPGIPPPSLQSVNDRVSFPRQQHRQRETNLPSGHLDGHRSSILPVFPCERLVDHRWIPTWSVHRSVPATKTRRLLASRSLYRCADSPLVCASKVANGLP